MTTHLLMGGPMTGRVLQDRDRDAIPDGYVLRSSFYAGQDTLRIHTWPDIEYPAVHDAGEAWRREVLRPAATDSAMLTPHALHRAHEATRHPTKHLPYECAPQSSVWKAVRAFLAAQDRDALARAIEPLISDDGPVHQSEVARDVVDALLGPAA